MGVTGLEPVPPSVSIYPERPRKHEKTHDFQADDDCMTQKQRDAKICKNKRGNANTLTDVGNFAGTFCIRIINNQSQSCSAEASEVT
jgi:hypothetical protein